VSDEVLDNLAWHALTGRQASFAEGSAPAVRYRRAVSVFSAVPDTHEASWRALAELTGPGRGFVLFQAGLGDLPAWLEELGRWPTWQMVADGRLGPPPGPQPQPQPAPEVVELGPADVDDMVALTDLTQPGPFEPETHELGTYLGVRDGEGRLLAMAGERMQTDGVAEISAVCTHPDARRLGLGARLTVAVAELIADRGQLPVLHVVKTNRRAIRLYQALGFQIRRDLDAVAARVPRSP
jgi:ribosomal protein S18 acetylase RimI-like enzyme